MGRKTVLITGASRGIGRATALQLAQPGMNLVLAARDYRALNEVCQDVRQRGGQAVAVPTDVTQRAQVADLVSEAMASFGRIDALVNCAGVGILRPALELTDEDIDRCYAVNVKGVILVTQAVAAEMMKGHGGRMGGRVITPVGTMGRYVMRGSAAYSASKWGATGALKAMAAEWQRQNIQFTLLYLGGVDTPFWDDIDMKVQRDKMLKAEDAANAIVYALQAPPYAVVNEMLIQPESHQMG
jgi:NAD(P)-dependent dehydrogenase (short-subunit alcohol dehydrogenase family)